MLKSGSTVRHPLISLLLLLLLVFLGAFIFTLIGGAIGGFIYGLKPLFDLASGKPGSLEFLKLIQIFSSFGMFIVSALLFAKFESNDWLAYLKLKDFSVLLFLLTILIMFSFVPILEWSNELNKSMKLPGFLKGIEDWMLRKELEVGNLTKQLLVMNSISVLLVNLLMFVVIPAFGEELIFRGCLQKIFKRLTGNYHIAIWITAIIFSAIHVQFYGFIPRMLLGALFGYLLVWSGSLWLPILAHFMNNAIAVITAYIYQQKGISLDKLDQPDPVSGSVYLISLVATSALLWFFYNQSLKQQSVIVKGQDGAGLG